MSIHREITPLKDSDCFLVFDRKRNQFSFPIHFHPEYEMNFIHNAKGAKRVVGDHIGVIDDYELVMVGSNVHHGWENYKNDTSKTLHEITIQCPRDLFSKNLLDKNVYQPIKNLLNNSANGILFSRETTINIQNKLDLISKKNGYDNFLLFQSILYDLAISRNQKTLTKISFDTQNDFHNSERIEKVYTYVKANYHNKIKVEDAANLVNMTVVSFSRLIKQRTGKTFVEFLNDLRLGYATRKLIETNKSISEICFSCGFNNISNFNKVFRKIQGCTPSEYRNNFTGVQNIY